MFLSPVNKWTIEHVTWDRYPSPQHVLCVSRKISNELTLKPSDREPLYQQALSLGSLPIN